jgi:hypothetical protein
MTRTRTKLLVVAAATALLASALPASAAWQCTTSVSCGTTTQPGQPPATTCTVTVTCGPKR